MPLISQSSLDFRFLIVPLNCKSYDENCQINALSSLGIIAKGLVSAGKPLDYNWSRSIGYKFNRL